MPRRDHLVPTMTVDRNGHAKTVYVNPAAGTPSASALSSAAPRLSVPEEQDDDWSAFADPGPWQDNDFSADDAAAWEWQGFSADDAAAWEWQGFSADDAAAWRDEDFTAADAADWKSEGFDTSDASAWRSEEFDANGAYGWKAAGIEPADAKKWDDQSLDPDDAKEWSASGFPEPETAKAWGDNGFNPGTASQWRDAGFTDASDAAAWHEGSKRAPKVDLNVLKELEGLGAEADDGAMWLNLLDEVHQMEDGKDETAKGLWETMDGTFPGAGDEYARHYPYRQWGKLAETGIDADSVSRVTEVQSAIESRWEEDWGDDYEEDPDASLSEACDWFLMTANEQSKHAAIVALVRGGHGPNEVSPFLKDYSHGLSYRGDLAAEDVLWACSAARSMPTVEQQDAAFEPFYRAISTPGIRAASAEHGPEKVTAAVLAGMTTEAQVRSFIEGIAVAGISEGAL